MASTRSMKNPHRKAYLIAEDVAFEVKDTGEIQKVVMKDEAEPEETLEMPETPQNTSTIDAPKTGDNTSIMALVLSCGLGWWEPLLPLSG